MYKQGLKPSVRMELMRSGGTINTLATLIEESIQIDNDLFELQLEERAFASRNTRGTNNGRNEKRPERNYRRQVRWAELLGQHKFKIVYTPGKDNGRADALSRRTDIAGTKKITASTVLQINEDRSLGPIQRINNLTMHISINVLDELQEQII
jgi:hypothetical protein